MVKDHVSEVVELFQSGFQCSQAVLASFSEEYGLPRETALKIACPFGGGMSGYGRTCGALTGAMMVMGLKHGTSTTNDPEAKNFSRQKSKALIEYFEKTHGSIQCNVLTGFDMSKLSRAELMERRTFFNDTCGKFLETVVAYLEEEL